MPGANVRGTKCVSEGKPADREEEGSADGKAEKGRGRVMFSFCSITVVYPVTFACARFVRTAVAQMWPRWRLRWKALWWFFTGQTGMSSWPEQLRLFSLLVFPDLINRLLCLCMNGVGCMFRLTIWKLIIFVLFFIFGSSIPEKPSLTSRHSTSHHHQSFHIHLSWITFLFISSSLQSFRYNFCCWILSTNYISLYYI